jgi:hypothetical protein
MTNPFSLRVPERCPRCDRTTSVRLQTVRDGATVTLTWYCARCRHEWPVAPDDATPPNDV